MEELLGTADALLPDDLLKDYTVDPDISINFEAWEQYKESSVEFMLPPIPDGD